MALDEDGELYIWGTNGLLIPHQIKIDEFKIEDILIQYKNVWIQTKSG